MKRIIIAILLFCCWTVSARAAIQAEPVSYNIGEQIFKGYIAYDDSISAKRPGILVVHEWWGHNDYARKRAEMLAKLGYTALALDMYGDGRQAEHPADASKFSAAIRGDLPEARKRFAAAMRLLQDHPTVDPQKIAAIGYCFGGGIVLQMARQGLDLDAVVSFHGSLATDTPALAGTVKARVLVCDGAEDKLVTPGQIQSFLREMQAAGVDYKFISYPGAKHSFTNPDADIFAEKFNIPLGYNAEADKRSWQDMQKFLNETFAK